MLKIGLTGGIGSGKTTVANQFQALGVPIIDADEISRELVQPGLPAFDLIVEAFGEAVLNEDHGLDRSKLRKLIFSEPESKRKLETILHPLIRQRIKQKIEALNSPYCIIAIPLLLETNQLSLVDRVLVVDVEPELQILRTQQRDGESRRQVEAIMATQADRQARIAVADDLLNNSGDIQQLKIDVEKLHKQYLHLLRKPI